MNLDHQLREALRREPAPADFAENVLARIAPARHRSGRSPVALALAAGLALAAILPWAISEHRRRQG